MSDTLVNPECIINNVEKLIKSETIILAPISERTRTLLSKPMTRGFLSNLNAFDFQQNQLVYIVTNVEAFLQPILLGPTNYKPGYTRPFKQRECYKMKFQQIIKDDTPFPPKYYYTFTCNGTTLKIDTLEVTVGDKHDKYSFYVDNINAPDASATPPLRCLRRRQTHEKAQVKKTQIQKIKKTKKIQKIAPLNNYLFMNLRIKNQFINKI